MMRHEQRKNRWPIAASLLVHFLFLGLALGSFAFGSRMIIRNTMLVNIVSDLPAGEAGDPKVDEPSQQLGSDTMDVPQAHLNTAESIRPRHVIAQEAASYPLVGAETDEEELKPVEDKMAYNSQSSSEPMKQTDQTVTMDMQSTLLSSVVAYGDMPLSGGGGSGAGSSGSESVSGQSQDTLAKFLAQVQQAIERERNKQYSRLARFKGLEGRTQLRFRITPTGEPTDIQVVQSSQSVVLDEEAIAIVRRAAPFPQLPVGLDQGLLIQLQVLFQLERG